MRNQKQQYFIYKKLQLPVGIDQRIAAAFGLDTVAVAEPEAFGTLRYCCRVRFGWYNIAGQLADFGDYFDIVVGIDEFREFVALELFVYCVHFGYHQLKYSNIAVVGSLVIAYGKRALDAGLYFVSVEFDDFAAFEVLRVT